MKLFVYGTLMRGEPNARQMEGARFVADARTAPAYTLVQLGRYPVLLPGGNTAVLGELYQVDDRVIRALDAFEGPGYRRVEIALENGAGAQAYTLAGDLAMRRPRVLAAGDWRRR